MCFAHFRVPRNFLSIIFFVYSLAFLASSAKGISFDSIDPEKINPEDYISWSASSAESYEDGRIVVNLRLQSKGTFGLYKKNLSFFSNSHIFSSFKGPEQEAIVDPITKDKVSIFRNGDFSVVFQGIKFKDNTFSFFVKYVACTTKICLFPHTYKVSVPVNLVKTPMALSSNQTIISVKEGVLTPSRQEKTINQLNDFTIEESLLEKLQTGNVSFLMLLLILFLGGMLTNLTPCVYPMIPITIRILGNQKSNPLVASIIYSLGIIIIYTLLGLFAALTGSLFGQYMASKSVNVIFAVIMFSLGISMIGVGQWKWLSLLGSRIGNGKNSLTRAFFMGCGAGFIAAPCTGPILAMLLTFVIPKGTLISTVYLFIYSLGFALPYAVLGRASSAIVDRKIPPLLQIYVKIVFAGVMFALALYYLRIPFYNYLHYISTYWNVVFWISGFLGVFSLSALLLHRKYNKLSMNIVPAVILGVCIFSGSQWLASQGGKISWHKSESKALAEAKEKDSLLLVDMWAEWCEACKKMDSTTFLDPIVVNEFKRDDWVFLKLDVTTYSETDQKYLDKYNVLGLPTLVLVSPITNRKKTITGYVSAKKLINEMRVFKGG